MAASEPVRAGVLAILGIAIFVYLAFAKSIPFTKPYEVHAVFSSSNQLHKGNPVRIAGVDVGKVAGHQPGPGTTQVVTLAISEQGQPVHARRHGEDPAPGLPRGRLHRRAASRQPERAEAEEPGDDPAAADGGARPVPPGAGRAGPPDPQRAAHGPRRGRGRASRAAAPRACAGCCPSSPRPCATSPGSPRPRAARRPATCAASCATPPASRRPWPRAPDDLADSVTALNVTAAALAATTARWPPACASSTGC